MLKAIIMMAIARNEQEQEEELKRQQELEAQLAAEAQQRGGTDEEVEVIYQSTPKKSKYSPAKQERAPTPLTPPLTPPPIPMEESNAENSVLIYSPISPTPLPPPTPLSTASATSPRLAQHSPSYSPTSPCYAPKSPISPHHAVTPLKTPTPDPPAYSPTSPCYAPTTPTPTTPSSFASSVKAECGSDPKRDPTPQGSPLTPTTPARRRLQYSPPTSDSSTPVTFQRQLDGYMKKIDLLHKLVVKNYKLITRMMKDAPASIQGKIPWLSIRSDKGVEGKQRRAKAYQARKAAQKRAILNGASTSYLDNDEQSTKETATQTEEQTPQGSPPAPTPAQAPAPTTEAITTPTAMETAAPAVQTEQPPRERLILRIWLDR
jgi:hypothetical protein